MHTFDPSTGEVEAGGSLSSRSGRPGLQSEFQDNQSYTEISASEISIEISIEIEL